MPNMKQRIILFISIFCFLTASIASGQNIGINTTGAAANTSAGLDVDFTSKGMLIPRVSLTSTVDVATITSPAIYLTVYNTNAAMTNGSGAGIYYYNGAKWVYMVAPSNGAGTSGQVLTSAGSGTNPTWTTFSASNGGCYSHFVAYNTNGASTFACPATDFMIEIWGAGGGGGNTGGAGGGGGGYAQKLYTNVSGTYSFAVGAGGAGAADNTHGGLAGGSGGNGGVVIRVYTAGISNGSVGSGTGGQFAFYDTTGTNLSATSSIFVATSTSLIGIGTTTPTALLSLQAFGGQALDVAGATGASLFHVNSGGNVGVGTTSANASFVVNGTISGGNLFQVASSTNQNVFLINKNGFVGVGTSTPQANFVLNGTINSGKNLFQVASSTNQNIFVIGNSGNIGVSTSTPWGRFSVTGADTSTKTPVLALADSNNKALFNVFDSGMVGGGTTSPLWAMTVSSAASSTGPQFALVDTTATSFAWTFRSISNTLYIATSTGIATSTVSAFTINPNGFVGIGTSSPGSIFSIGNVANFTGATTTFSSTGGVNITKGCYAIAGTCIGYIQKIAQIYATSTAGTSTVSFGTAAGYSGSTLTLPATTTQIVVEEWGGGGGGGAGVASNAGGTGGGSGGYAEKLISTPSGTYKFVIGTGGAGGTIGANNATNGVATCFSSNAIACVTPSAASNGGIAGGDQGFVVGLGGTSTAGDIQITGATGGGSGGSTVTGGNGGNAPRGGGGGAGGTWGQASQAVANGANGAAFGGGGGGGGGNNTGNASGGNGGTGGVVITIYATSSTNNAGNDYAEMFPVSNPGINAGDIVAVDAGAPVSMKYAQAGDTTPLAGIVSTAPGQVLGDQTAPDERPIAFSGRVPANVNLEGGPIAIGDRIAPSSVPGIGKKAGTFDDSVGIALSAYDGTQPTSQVMVFMDLQKGVDINSIAFGLLGPSNPIFASVSSPSTTASAPVASSTSPLDFVGGVMNAIASRIAAITGSTSTSTGATSTLSTSTRVDQYAAGFLHDLLTQITQWFATTTNGIGDFFANRVHTQQLCLSDGTGSSTCITKAQLDALLAGNASGHTSAGGESTSSGGGSSASGSSGGGSSISTSSGGSSTSTPPAISVSGNDPATVDIGATYTDLGASIIGPTADLNLGITASVDGATSTPVSGISIDTSVVGTHTITYSATDQNGLVGTATRTVNVVPAGSGSSSSATSSAGSSASSTDSSNSNTSSGTSSNTSSSTSSSDASGGDSGSDASSTTP